MHTRALIALLSTIACDLVSIKTIRIHLWFLDPGSSEMVKLQTGSIDCAPLTPLISEAALDEVEKLAKRPLSPSAREQLRHVHYVWCERLEMLRPEFSDVSAILTKLIKLANPTRQNEFAVYMSELASAKERENPGEFVVHDILMARLKIFVAIDWRDDVKRGKVDLSAVREILQEWKKELLAKYRNIQGGKRDHDLGWVIEALADVCEETGIKVSYSTYVDSIGQERIGGAFIDFCKTFISHLPEKPGIPRPDIAHLIANNFAKFDVVRRRRK